MVENDSNRLGPYSRILFIIALAILILILPGLVRRGFIVALSATFSIIFVFLAAYGVLVLWSDRQNFRKWYRQLLKWAVIIDLALALVLTMAYILTATPITLAGFELHFVDRVIATYSAGRVAGARTDIVGIRGRFDLVLRGGVDGDHLARGQAPAERHSEPA